MQTGLARWLLPGAVLVCGCLNPFTTKLPSVHPRHPEAEKKSYQLHDPYPSEELGPETLSRPRGFDVPRSEQRRALESQMLPQTPPNETPATPRHPRRNRQYPQSVPQQ